jgi:hypothetical protein
MADPLRQQGKALENQFFSQMDQKLLAQLRVNLEMAPQREVLATVSNIKNPDVLDKLLDMGITGETFAALTYVPLAAVAWADGTIDPAERQAVLQAAEAHGTKKGALGYALLQTWLEHPPGPELLHTWRDYILELRKTVDPQWITKLKAEVMDFAEQVAEASGGILGLIQRVSTAERRKLDELARTFDGG